MNAKNGKLLKCFNCNAKHYKSKSRLKFDKMHFCSRGCHNNWMKEHLNMHKHNCWQGGRSINNYGYIMIALGKGKRRAEHVLIVEKMLGRKIKTDEVVHHINGIKTDNKNSNLIICSRGYHGWIGKRMAELYQKEHLRTGRDI